MNEFTFIMLTYNQERYVIEHLESIKYQIIHFGNNYVTSFVLCDDCSMDNTVKYVKMWLAENKQLFFNITINVSAHNEGIVRNYEKALKLVQTKKFKILAGDDLYYKNSIFEGASLSNFVISPTIRFENGGRVKGIFWMQNYIFKLKGNVKKKLLKMLKYVTPLETPGIFFDSDFIDQGLFDALKEYNWIEDIPEWNYILNLEKTSISFSPVPLIIYRSNVGISTCSTHQRNQEFEREFQYIKKNIQINYGKFPKYIDPYRYKYAILELLYKNRKWYNFDINECRLYINEINILSNKWIETHDIVGILKTRKSENVG